MTILICIESFSSTLLDEIIEELKIRFSQDKLNVRFLSFPSKGPFGHQLRVVEGGRIAFHPRPYHLLHMVDRMDAFLNPLNGISLMDPAFDLILVTGSQFKEALQANDEELQRWIVEINRNFPEPEIIFWLSDKENEQHSAPVGFPPIENILIQREHLTQIAARLYRLILQEVEHA